MSDVKDISAGLGRLDSQLDDLEDALEPLLTNLGEMSSQLPLLDKAKLFSLTAYSIESLLFSTLKLEGNDTQSQEVLSELKRIQQYFGKIKSAEEPEGTRTLTVNQEAAARILKSDLSDNKTIANKLAEKIAEERARALLKNMENKKRGAEEPAASAEASSNEGKSSKSSKDKHHAKKKKKSKK